MVYSTFFNHISSSPKRLIAFFYPLLMILDFSSRQILFTEYVRIGMWNQAAATCIAS